MPIRKQDKKEINSHTRGANRENDKRHPQPDPPGDGKVTFSALMRGTWGL